MGKLNLNFLDVFIILSLYIGVTQTDCRDGPTLLEVQQDINEGN